jgi:predicted GIY-YIG superfamily endonuclease
MPRRLNIKLSKGPCVVIHRAAFRNDKLVYVACANKKIRYPVRQKRRIAYMREKSRIVYIGTTRKGARRIASTAAAKGEELLYDYGMKALVFYVVTCTRRRGVESWRKLERALIIRFRELYGDIPKGNKSGRFWRWKDEKDYFSQDGLTQVIDELS